MQINPIPQPIIGATNTSPQNFTQALPQVQALAAAPITQRAVTPPEKTEKGRHSRTNKEKDEGEAENRSEPDNSRGHFINRSV